MLELRKVSKSFFPGTPNERRALVDVDLSLAPGDFVTIIGGNGAGKSTLFNAVGRLFQAPLAGTAPNMTIEENLAMAYLRGIKKGVSLGLNKKDEDFFREKLSELGLGLEDRLKTKMGLLSGGQRQAVTLMMATIVPPKLLLLDEHTAALDPGTAEKVSELTRKIVERDHITTMMITHNMQQSLEMGNRTIMMDEGRIVLDLKGEERTGMTDDGLLALFRARSEKEGDNDRLLLS